MDSLQRLTPAVDAGDGVFGIGFPHEWRWALVVLIDEVVDGRLPSDHGMKKDAALELAAAGLGEEALYGVEPRRQSGVKWKV